MLMVNLKILKNEQLYFGNTKYTDDMENKNLRLLNNILGNEGNYENRLSLSHNKGKRR